MADNDLCLIIAFTINIFEEQKVVVIDGVELLGLDIFGDRLQFLARHIVHDLLLELLIKPLSFIPEPLKEFLTLIDLEDLTT